MLSTAQYERVGGGETSQVKLHHKVKVLLWKMYILRKRHWIIMLLEVIVPIIVFWIVVHFKNLLPEDRKIVYDTNPKRYNEIIINGTYKIAYTPSNTFTDTIMSSVSARLTAFGCPVTLLSKSSEGEVVDWLKDEYIMETRNSTLDFTFYSMSSKGIGIVFLDCEDTENLKYILRTTRGGLDTSEDTLYGEQNGFSIYSYHFSGFTTIQAAIDQAYLLNFHGVEASNGTLVAQLPAIEYMAVDLVDMLLPTIVSLGFTFVMPSLLREIVEEKTSGIKEMMKIMGLKSWINWLNWVVYSLFVYVPVTLVVTGLLTIDSGSGPSVEANFLFVWALFILFTLAFITLIFATSTVFTDGTIAMIAGEIAWYGTTILLDTFIVRAPDKFGIWVNLLTCLCPSIALVWSFNTINIFHKNGHPWTLKNLFDDGAGGGRVSVGLAIIMLCVDIALFSVVTWYIDNVRPGPYGRAEPLTFIFKRFKKKDYNPKFPYVKRFQKNYETPPKNLKVGIRIEHLQKTFCNGKVVAVENVDLDIYEGNITALLGHNGAGKSTTMSILSGFFSPTRGRVIVKGKNIFDNMEDFRSSLGLCLQQNLLFSFLTVYEHLIFFGMLKGLSMNLSKQEGKTLLRTLKIYGKRKELVSKLSGGMKRKLCLAIALMGDPQVLMLDEPTSGLDPESRRQIWDMLLSSRGERTTIITTHFMEEADVLGDRIAIMNHGQVSCYGTPMFLKKVYGTGYNLNISKVEQAAEPPITRTIGQYVTIGTMKQSSPSQLTYNIKSDESSQFPALFSALDSWRNELGLMGMSITCTTMEDVFLKVAEDPENAESSNEHMENGDFVCKQKYVTTCGMTLLQLKALVYKRAVTRIRTWISTLIFTIVPIVLMAATMMKVMEQDHAPNQPNLLISLISFPGVHVAVSSDNHRVNSVIQNIVASGRATYKSIPTGINLNTYVTEKINDSLIQYEIQMIAGFEVTNTYALGAYSQYFVHSPVLVLNMIANTLLQLASPSSNITVYNHPITVKDSQDMCDLSMAAPIHVFNFPLHMILLSLGLLILTMSFISFPLKERVSNTKQLQLMTGVSPLLYWMINILCDVIIYFITVALMVCMVFIFQIDGILTASGYTGTLVLVFALFGTSGIPFAYLFSFLVNSSVKASVLFLIINMVTGTFGGAFLAILDGSYTGYGIWRFFLSFNPLFSATSAFIHLITIMYIDGACLLCGRNCNTQNPLEFLESGPNTKNPHGINNFLLFLIIDTFIYFGLLLVIEYGITKKIVFLISTLWIKISNDNFEEDSDVFLERERILSSQKLQAVAGYINNTAVLRVNDLGKKYNRKATAVRGVTFQVGQGECFGLLGVNGAGKTTTFKMLTGDEIPNKGDASIIQLSLLKQKSRFLAKIGYCPQFDGINKLLTGREMLHVFALLRGIPSTYCDSEVSRWIQKMGLKEYADRPCGTYSGGNKRKLSTAMAFIGEPPVVFLDEPTSGVDPVSRRKLWDVMSKCKQDGQAIVLTSHSMEECEALCSRLTIMVAGQMKCIGSAQYLKHKFGQGYTIKIKLHSSQQLQSAMSMLKYDMASHFRGCSIKDEHLGLIHYHVPDPSISLSELFTKMEHLNRRYEIIEDYIVSDTTLEQVFMSFARALTSGQL